MKNEAIMAKIKEEIMQYKDKIKNNDSYISSYSLGSVLSRNNLSGYFCDVYRKSNRYFITLTDNNESIYVELRMGMKPILVIDYKPFTKLVYELDLYEDEVYTVDITNNNENDSERKCVYVTMSREQKEKLFENMKQFANLITKTHESLILTLIDINKYIF